MDIGNIDIKNITLIDVFKILLKTIDLGAAKGNSDFAEGNLDQNEYIGKRGENAMVFMTGLYLDTVGFLRDNFKKEDLLQIDENMNWGGEKCTAAKNLSTRLKKALRSTKPCTRISRRTT